MPPSAHNPEIVILVGGLGTRLRATIGESTPKALAPIKGRPFLWYLLRYVADLGFRRVILATGHLSEAFREDFEGFAPDGMDLTFSVESAPRGTAGALVEALPHITSDPFIALNGDSFVNAPLPAMLDRHAESGAAVTMALARVENSARFGTVLADADGAISAFREKTGQPEPGWINAGMYVFAKAALAPVVERYSSSLETDVFPHWVGRGLRAFPVESAFIDIGIPETYQDAGRFFEECGYV